MDRGRTDELFVLGRNIYQCADGSERRAKDFMRDLRRELATFPAECAEHLLNGMFYEVYFNRKGEFRGAKLKGGFLSELFALETVAKFERSVAYMQYVLDPYRSSLCVLPNKVPEILKIEVKIDAKDPPVITSINCSGKEQLIPAVEDVDDTEWRLSYRSFTLEKFEKNLTEFWHIPNDHVEFKYDKDLPEATNVVLASGKSVGALKI